MYEYIIKDSIWLKFEYLNLVHQSYCYVTCRLYRDRVQRGLRSRVGWGTKSSEKPKNQRSWDDQSRLVSSDWMIGWWFLKIGRMRPRCGTHLSGPPRHGQAQALKPRRPRCRGRSKKKGEASASPKIFFKRFWLFLLLKKTDSFFFAYWMVVHFLRFFLEGNLMRNILINKQSIYFFVGCIRPM